MAAKGEPESQDERSHGCTRMKHGRKNYAVRGSPDPALRPTEGLHERRSTQILQTCGPARGGVGSPAPSTDDPGWRLWVAANGCAGLFVVFPSPDSQVLHRLKPLI